MKNKLSTEILLIARLIILTALAFWVVNDLVLGHREREYKECLAKYENANFIKCVSQNFIIIKMEDATSTQPVKEEKFCQDKIKVADMTIRCDHLEVIISHFGKDEKLIAIIIQESRFNPMAVNVNNNNSIDRGIYQLNSTWWKFKDGDFVHNTKEAVKCKSELGYECWWAYRNGDYKQNIPLAKEILTYID